VRRSNEKRLYEENRGLLKVFFPQSSRLNEGEGGPGGSKLSYQGKGLESLLFYESWEALEP